MKTVFTVILFMVLFVVFLYFWVRYQETQGLYHPTRFEPGWFETLPADYEAVNFSGEDETELRGVWRQGQADKPVLILAHGNAGDVRGRMYWFDLVLPQGWSGLIFDYRGYGASEGSPHEAGLYMDIVAAIDYARGRSGEGEMFLHGRSLGVPVVSYGASMRRIDGLILDSGFPDAVSVARKILPLPGLGHILKINFNTIDYLHAAHENFGPLPKLVIHGTADRVLPFGLGKKIFENAPEPKDKWFVEGAGHNDLIYIAGEENYSRSLRDFLESVTE